MKKYFMLLAVLVIMTAVTLLVIAALNAHRWLLSALLVGIWVVDVLAIISDVVYDDICFWRYWNES